MTNYIAEMKRLIEEKSLLKHPFYTKWVAGELPKENIQEYCRQYYQFEAAFPRMLSRIHSQIPDREDRTIVLENLIDEERGDSNHAELWLRFAEAMGVSRDEVKNTKGNAATQHMVKVYTDMADSSPQEGLAALYAYEKQVPEVAQAKIDGLAAHYGVNTHPGITFWTVHREADVAHSGAEEALLNKLAGEKAIEATKQALDAWYGFLDAVDAPAS